MAKDIDKVRDVYVSLSIRTIGKNAYKGGDLIEVGAVKFDLKGKLIDTFYAVNNVNYEFTNEDFAKLGFNRAIYDAEKQNDYLWMYKLTEFIQDTTVITFDAYETFNHLKALGLELYNLIDLKAVFFLTDKRFNTSLEYHIKKNKIVTPHIFRALRKPMMLKELFLKEYKKKLKRDINDYLNVIYVEEKKERYKGVTGGVLIYSDGRKEVVVDMIDEYDKEITSRYIYEESLLGDDISKSVKNLTYMFEGISLDVKHIPPIFFRASFEGYYYLWSPLGLFKEDGFELEEIYDLGKMSVKKAESRIMKYFEDTELYDFCIRVLKLADPDYEIQEFDYFKEDISPLLITLENVVREFNKYPAKFRALLISQIDDRMTEGVFNYVINVEDNKLSVKVMYDIEFDTISVDEEGTSSLLLDENIYTVGVDAIGYVQFRKDIYKLMEYIISTIDESVDKLPDASILNYGTYVTDKFETHDSLLKVYDKLVDEYMYISVGDKIFVQSGAKYTLILGFDGSISVKNNKDNVIKDIENLYDLYMYSEKFYRTANEHYKILEKLLNTDVEKFEVSNKEYDSLNNIIGKDEEGYDFNDDLKAVELDETSIETQYSETHEKEDSSEELIFEDVYNEPLIKRDSDDDRDDLDFDIDNYFESGYVFDEDTFLEDDKVEESNNIPSKELSKDLDEDLVEELSKDLDEDLVEDLSKDLDEDLVEDLSKDLDEDLVEDLSKDLDGGGVVLGGKDPYNKLNNLKQYNIDLDTELTNMNSKGSSTKISSVHTEDKFISDDFKGIGMNLDELSKIPVGFYDNDRKSMAKVIKNIVKIIKEKGIDMETTVKVVYYDGEVVVNGDKSEVIIDFDSAIIRILNKDNEVGIKID